MLGIEQTLSTLLGKTYTFQFKVKEDDLWQEDPWILDLKVISSRALIHRLFEVSHRFLIENVIGAQLTFAVTELNIRHFEPTPLGATITLQLSVEKAFRNHITFTFVAYDEHDEIAKGTLSRVALSKDVIGRITQAKSV